MELSPAMRDALEHAHTAGSLVRRRGGFWTEPDARPRELATHHTPYDEWEWYAGTRTVRALVTRGLLELEGDRAATVAGMLDLYHRTTPAAADEIRRTGMWRSRENTREVYFSSRQDGQAEGYGDAVIHVRVPESIAELEDEFPDGELHYRVPADKLNLEHIVAS